MGGVAEPRAVVLVALHLKEVVGEGAIGDAPSVGVEVEPLDDLFPGKAGEKLELDGHSAAPFLLGASLREVPWSVRGERAEVGGKDAPASAPEEILQPRGASF